MSAAAARGRAKRLRPKDLPTLQEALCACNRTLLERVIIEDFACRGALVDKGQHTRMRRRLDTTLDAMASLPADRKALGGWVLVPRESYVLDAGNGSIGWRLHAALVPLPDAKAVERVLKAMEGCTSSYAHVKKADRRLRALVASGASKSLSRQDAFLEERSYSLIPWEETLGCRVWLGGGWCERDRYVALASAFWEMTFFGFEYDKVQARMAREKAARLIGSPDSAASSKAADGKGSRAPSKALKAATPGGFGSHRPDRFDGEGRKRLAQRVAVLNHNARQGFCTRLLDLARRLERS